MALALLLAGCTPREVVPPGQPIQHTTVYRYTSAPAQCPKPEVPRDTELRRMKQSRDEWKRYAEYLETLLPPDTSHDSHP